MQAMGTGSGLELSGAQFATILISFSVVLVFSWCWTVKVLKPELMTLALEGGWAIRIVVSIFIVSAATMLAVIGKIEGSAAVVLLSGTAGYILGSGPSSKQRPGKSNGGSTGGAEGNVADSGKAGSDNNPKREA